MSKEVMFEEEQLEKLADELKETFEEYASQRDDIDEEYALADWMYKCGTARGTWNTERRQWVPRFVDGKANMGSVLMHRQVNTLAGILNGILLSGRDYFRYEDKEVKGSPLSEETGAHSADCMNALARWVWRQDGLERKIPEFCTAIFKQSNIFAHISMKREYRRVVESVIEPEEAGVDEEGNPIYNYVRRQRLREGQMVEYPTVTFPYPRNVYANKYISTMQDQETVYVLSISSRHRIMAEAKWFDKEALAEVDWEDMVWDGQYGADGKRSDLEHAGREDLSPRKGPVLRWDVYHRALVVGNELYDEDKHKNQVESIKSVLTWSTWIGNDIASAVCLRCIEGSDPDDEIPIEIIRVSADDADMLYHSSLSKVVRSPYSADCALLNAMADNVALLNDPPRSVIPGMHQVKDFGWKAGAVYQVTDHGAIDIAKVPDATLQTTALRDQIREDAKLALATDDARVGQYAGARTSATEVLQVTGNTETTIALRNAYIIGQLLPWMARKYVSYCREFMDPEIIQRVLNEQMPGRAYGEFIGEYDFVVDIMTQYETDEMLEMRLDKAMQILTNPALIESETHRTDVGELLRMYMDHLKLKAGRVILPPDHTDSEANARQKVQIMLKTGNYMPPEEGENVKVHLRVAQAERMRWRGLEDSNADEAANLELLDNYIGDLKQMAGGAAGAPQQPRGPEVPATPGGEMQQQLGGMMGEQFGG